MVILNFPFSPLLILTNPDGRNRGSWEPGSRGIWPDLIKNRGILRLETFFLLTVKYRAVNFMKIGTYIQKIYEIRGIL